MYLDIGTHSIVHCTLFHWWDLHYSMCLWLCFHPQRSNSQCSGTRYTTMTTSPVRRCSTCVHAFTTSFCSISVHVYSFDMYTYDMQCVHVHVHVDGPFTFQVSIFPSGVIHFVYREVSYSQPIYMYIQLLSYNMHLRTEHAQLQMQNV